MLRILRFNNKAVNEVQIQFSEELDSGIGIANIKIISNSSPVRDLSIKTVDITSDVITVETSPQSPLATYSISLLSTDSQSFVSSSGNVLQGRATFNFIGQERTNEIRDSVIDGITSVYDVDNDSLVRKHIAGVSDQLLKGRTDIRETGNSNYLSVEISKELLTNGDLPEEIKERGFGPTDRLSNEGAYEILRVGSTPEGTTYAKVLRFDSARASALVSSTETGKVNSGITTFPSDPLSLRSVNIINEVVSNSERLINSFDSTLITLSNKNIVAVHSITLNNIDVYDIPNYGYALNSNRYDTIFGRTLISLESNQLKLSDSAILGGAFPLPSAGDTIKVSYSYIDNGVNADAGSLSISKVKAAAREAVPPVITIFSLKNYPVVTSSDAIPDYGNVTFLDPSPDSGTPFTKTHPAFSTEIVYDSSNLPSNSGEYSVNYLTGQVFVYGESSNNGTGNEPPVASYNYRKTFQKGIDYNLSLDDDEIVVVPGRDLVDEEVKVTFDYEKVFAEGTDYLAESHIEVINEYVENRIDLTNLSIIPSNFPVTDVFEVFNETTGETYSISRFTDDRIYFNGKNLPRLTPQANEQVTFKLSPNESLFVTEEVSNNGTIKVLKIELEHSDLVSFSGQKGGSNVNNEVLFSKVSLYLREYFYDDVLQTVDQNLSKMTTIGDYIIDYSKGIVYLLTSSSQDDSIGAISYKYGVISPRYLQISGINDIGYRKSVKGARILEVGTESFTSDDITVTSLPNSVERFLGGDSTKPILFGTKQFGQAGQSILASYEFVATDGLFSEDFDDGYHILRMPGEPDRSITSITSTSTLLVDIPFDETNRSLTWCIIDFNLSDGYQAITTYEIDYVKGVYTVTDLQTNDRDSLTNLYDPNLDTFDGKTITFNNSIIGSVSAGTALAIDYSFGTLFTSYDYWKDILRVSYEHGDNSLNWSISDAMSPGDQYFVSYRYGALRDKLLENFGALTQVEELTSFPLDFDRELYRNFLTGTLQGFVGGPTNESVKTLVESVTGIEPGITELTFNEWTVSRDNLHLEEPAFKGTESYASGKFESGLIIDDDKTLSVPAESYISHREGTFEGWLKPNWDGIDNDADITVTVSADPSAIYIGSSAFNPAKVPFSVNRVDSVPYSPVGRPINYPDVAGHFLWYDADTSLWNFESTTDGYGEIITSGEFYNVTDGYTLTSTSNYIKFDGYDDGLDGAYTDGYEVRNAFTFSSDDSHYIFDSGVGDTHNRLSLYKDGAGYLTFRVYDDSGRRDSSKSKSYTVSKNIQDWVAGEPKFTCASWRLDTADGIDELHLFVDGQEVSNLFKYGGKPKSVITDIYRTVADEVLISSAVKTVIGNSNGVTAAGSNSFDSAGNNFVTNGIIAGDTLTILDGTADGANSPYSITGVSEESLIFSGSPLLLSLSDVSFTVNQAVFTPSTNIDVESFAIFTEDGYGVRSELYGLDATEPDYTISREGAVNTVKINNSVTAGDQIIINTLGLSHGRCRDLFYSYSDGYNSSTIEARGAPPSSFSHVDIYKVIVKRFDIVDDGYMLSGDGYLAIDGDVTVAASEADGYFLNVCNPSNTVTGKQFSATLGSFDNIDFGGTNTVTFTGTTFAGPTTEVLTYSAYATLTTTNYFTSLDLVEFTFTATDPSISFGSLQVIETVPLTSEENNGEHAQISGYENGVFTLVIYGSGGTSFTLESCHYLLDYPVDLNIPMQGKGQLNIGGSNDGAGQLDGIMDQVVFLNEMLGDVRAGEDAGSTRTITEDYNSPVPLTQTPQTLMLLDMNDEIKNSKVTYKTFDENFLTSSRSVNDDFGDSVVFLGDDSLLIDNGAAVFKNDSGTIEFWISPIIETKYDLEIDRYYVDITSIRVEQVVSSTAISLILPTRAKSIVSIRQLDDSGSGVDYFGDDGKLFVDGQTIILGTRLPSSKIRLEVQYIPIDLNGDRVSIFKDTSGNLNFSIRADGQEYLIHYPIRWNRDSWHRIMATWTTNSILGDDKMRLFVDGVEGGTILWGTPGLVYGTGLIWGSAAVGTAGSNALVSNIDLEDTFAELHIGNSFDKNNPSRAKMDNFRVSDIQREPSIIGLTAADLNYNSNLGSVVPVVSDNYTTLLLDFDRNAEETEFLSNLLSKHTPLFNFDVNIDDSFGRMTDSRSKELMTNVIGRMKPAHTDVLVNFINE